MAGFLVDWNSFKKHNDWKYMDFVFLYRDVLFVGWFGFQFWFSFYCAQRLEKEGQMSNWELCIVGRRWHCSFSVINTHNVAGTTGGNDGMVLFDLASRALIKFCVMHWNIQTHWDIKYRWSFSTFPCSILLGEKKGDPELDILRAFDCFSAKDLQIMERRVLHHK